MHNTENNLTFNDLIAAIGYIPKYYIDETHHYIINLNLGQGATIQARNTDLNKAASSIINIYRHAIGLKSYQPLPKLTQLNKNQKTNHKTIDNPDYRQDQGQDQDYTPIQQIKWENINSNSKIDDSDTEEKPTEEKPNKREITEEVISDILEKSQHLKTLFKNIKEEEQNIEELQKTTSRVMFDKVVYVETWRQLADTKANLEILRKNTLESAEEIINIILKEQKHIFTKENTLTDDTLTDDTLTDDTYKNEEIPNDTLPEIIVEEITRLANFIAEQDKIIEEYKHEADAMKTTAIMAATQEEINRQRIQALSVAYIDLLYKASRHTMYPST